MPKWLLVAVFPQEVLFLQQLHFVSDGSVDKNLEQASDSKQCPSFALVFWCQYNLSSKHEVSHAWWKDNWTEQPVFAEHDKDVELRGDPNDHRKVNNINWFVLVMVFKHAQIVVNEHCKQGTDCKMREVG